MIIMIMLTTIKNTLLSQLTVTVVCDRLTIIINPEMTIWYLAFGHNTRVDLAFHGYIKLCANDYGLI